MKNQILWKSLKSYKNTRLTWNLKWVESCRFSSGKGWNWTDLTLIGVADAACDGLDFCKLFFEQHNQKLDNG